MRRRMSRFLFTIRLTVMIVFVLRKTRFIEPRLLPINLQCTIFEFFNSVLHFLKFFKTYRDNAVLKLLHELLDGEGCFN